MAVSEQSIVSLTDAARERVRGFQAEGASPNEHGMWVQVTGSAGGEYTYAMALKPLVAARRSDVIARQDELTVVIPADSVERLRGATIDWTGDAGAGGLQVSNPNKPPAAAAPPTLPTLPMAGGPGPAPASPAIGGQPGDLSGDVAQRVMQVLERQVNPAIASHGGMAQLVAVEDETAFLRLGGGCQGCGMATVTLSQGIETAIRDAVPEIGRVVDVTDHTAGRNPYFEPAKK